MSTSSPADLATAFRSFHRRLAEAPGDDASPAAIDAAAAAVQTAITNAAVQLGAAATAEGVAAAIDHRHLSEWSDSELQSLQQEATTAAKAIRDLQNSSGN